MCDKLACELSSELVEKRLTTKNLFSSRHNRQMCNKVIKCEQTSNVLDFLIVGHGFSRLSADLFFIFHFFFYFFSLVYLVL